MADPVLKQGATGNDVAYAQQLLNCFGYSLSVDGIFGSETSNAVRDFQMRAGLVSDGVIGPQTWASLNSPLTLVDTQGKQTTGTLSPIPVNNQLNNQVPYTTSGSTPTNWKLWGMLAVIGAGVWWLLGKDKGKG